MRTRLDWKWSPQQMAATLKRVLPDERDRHVCREIIYTAIYTAINTAINAQLRGELRKQLVDCRRHRRRPPHAAVAGGGPARADSRHGQHPCARPRWMTASCPVTGKAT